jgi:5-methylcytosine-specific restriction endonuclease McrA
MPQIFVFTAGNPEARKHLADSIQSPIDDPRAKVFGNFDELHHKELARIKEEGRGFYAWGAVPGTRNIPTWEQMERGDFVLCVYDATYRYVARVLAKYDNPKRAESIWGTNDERQTWRYMYFLSEPIEIYQPLYEFEGHLNSSYRGFTRISDPRLDEIEEDYGSLDDFINEILEREDPNLPKDLQVGSSDADSSEEIAEVSLEVDDITHGIQDKDHKPQSEGRKRIVQAVQYERSPKNRKKAIDLHGTICTVCDFDFDEVYGEDYARSYIQIHHINPVSKYEGEVDPKTDLVPLCANCHAMAHKRRDTVTSIEELKELIEKAKG